MEKILASSSLDEFMHNLQLFINSEDDFNKLLIVGNLLKYCNYGIKEIKGYEGEIVLYFNREEIPWRYIIEQKIFELRKIIQMQNLRYEFDSGKKCLFKFHVYIFFNRFKNLKVDFLLRDNDYLSKPMNFYSNGDL